MSQPIVVLGLAHTGTSAIAGALRILGVRFPDVDYEWETYSENLQLVDSFNGILNFDSIANRNLSELKFTTQIAEYGSQYKGYCWGFKSPHFAQSKNTVRTLFELMPENTLYCVTSRDPIAIAHRRIKAEICRPTDRQELFQRRLKLGIKITCQLDELQRTVLQYSGRRNFLYLPFENMAKEGGPEKLVRKLVQFTEITTEETMVKEAIKYISPKNGYQSPLKFIFKH